MEALARYLARLRFERGYSPATLKSYQHDLNLLVQLLGGREWAQLEERDIRRWVADATRAGLAARTIARRLSAWRGFLDQLATEGTIGANPARSVSAPRMPRRLPKALAPDLAVRLVAFEPDDTFETVRDKAMVELLYSTGLRLAELAGLDLRYCDEPGYRSACWLALAESEVTVRGKGGKSRTVPVGAAARTALEHWLAVRNTWLEGHQDADLRPLFLSSRGRRLSHRAIQVRIKRLAVRLGIPVDVHPHVLRHSFASHLLQSSGDLRAVQELLGHASIVTTQVYTSLDFQRLAAVYDAAHPRAHRKG